MSPLANDPVPTEEALNAFNRERDAIAADIQAFAEKLLADPRARAAFARVGLDEEFREEEARLIDVEFGLGTAFETPSWMASRDYRNLVRALARRVLTGMYPSIHSAEATDFVTRNVFPEQYYHPPHGTPKAFRPGYNKIAFEDLLRLVRELGNWKDYDRHSQAFRDQENNIPDDPGYTDNLKPIYAKEFEIKQRHGLVGRFPTKFIITILRRDNRDINNDDHIKEVVIQIGEAESVRF